MEVEKSNRRVISFGSCCQVIVRCLKEKLEIEKRDPTHALGKSQVNARLKLYTGLSNTSIDRLSSNIDIPNQVYDEGSQVFLEMSEDEFQEIRPAFIRLVRKKIRPRLSDIVEELQKTIENWRWKRTTVRKAMLLLGFEFNSQHKNYYDFVAEKPENVKLRHRFIRKFLLHVKQNKQIVCMDESWINKNCKVSKIWHDHTFETVEEMPKGKGKRWIMIGAGSQTGWIQNSFVMWKGDVKSEDYHEEMNADIFNDWLVRYLLPNIARDAVIILDRASYHTALTYDSRAPNATWTKLAIVNWLQPKLEGKYSRDDMLLTPAIFPDEAGGEKVYKGFSKEFLLMECEPFLTPPKMRITETIEQWNQVHNTEISYNFLPVAHPQLNPIEKVWALIKSYVAKKNTTYKMNRIRDLAITKKEEISPDIWNACYKSSWEVATAYDEMQYLNDDIEEMKI